MHSLTSIERAKYDRYWQEAGERVHSPGMRAIEDFLAAVNFRGWRRVLDLGCGTGRCAVRMLAEGLDVRAVDLVPNCLDLECAELVGTRFTVAPAWSLPFSDDVFDVVFCVDVMEHIPAEFVPNVFRELSRVAPYAYLEIADFEREVAGLNVHPTVRDVDWWLSALIWTHRPMSIQERKRPKTSGYELWLKRCGKR